MCTSVWTVHKISCVRFFFSRTVSRTIWNKSFSLYKLPTTSSFYIPSMWMSR